jgi:fructuronate reductase
VADPVFVAYMRRMMEREVASSLKVPQGVDLRAYQDALVQRFKNPALPHRTQQIAMDGSQKLPQRLLGTVRDNLAAGRPIDLIALAIAGWMRYVGGVDEHAREIVVADPLAGEFKRLAANYRGDPAAWVRALLGVRAVFGDDLPADERLVAKLVRWLDALVTDGAQRTVAAAVAAAD